MLQLNCRIHTLTRSLFRSKGLTRKIQIRIDSANSKAKNFANVFYSNIFPIRKPTLCEWNDSMFSPQWASPLPQAIPRLTAHPNQSGVCWFLYPINQYYIHSITDGVLQMLVNLILWCIDLASIFQMISKRMMVISTWNLQQYWKFP